MKPAAAISAVVIAVLVTVVIEESRIKQLRAEVTRLRELPGRSTPGGSGDGKLAQEPPSTADAPPGETGEPGPSPEPAEAPALPGRRQVPVDYPAPADDVVKQLAQGPYAQLHLELGLTNREAAYLEEALMAQGMEMRELAARWVEALPDDRAQVKAAMDAAEARAGERIRNFLGNDEDFTTFTTYRAKQPEREMLGQMLPILDQQGVVLEIEQEQALVDAMHQAREATGGIHWNSPTAIKVIAAGDAVDRFEEQWNKIGETLRSELGDILEPAQVDAVLAARDQLKAPRLESVKATAAAIQGTDP